MTSDTNIIEDSLLNRYLFIVGGVAEAIGSGDETPLGGTQSIFGATIALLKMARHDDDLNAEIDEHIKRLEAGPVFIHEGGNA